MGMVYQALDRELGIDIALKVLRAPPLGSGVRGSPYASGMHQRFTRELLLAREITHRNVIRIHDIGEIDGIRFISMPLVRGRDLAVVLEAGPLPVSRAVLHARQIAAGLAAVHTAGVIHRDLKPANVMICDDSQAVLMDFGIARSMAPVGQQWTAAGAAIGTAAYMAPEQARGEEVDQRGDVYAFGLILHEMLCGTKPLLMPELLARMKVPPPPAHQLNPKVPAALSAIVTRCLQPSPADRYQQIDEVAAALAGLRRERRGIPYHLVWNKWLTRAAAAVVVLGAMAFGHSQIKTVGGRSAVATATHAVFDVAVPRVVAWTRVLNPILLMAREEDGTTHVPSSDASGAEISVPNRQPERIIPSTPSEARAQYARTATTGPSGVSLAAAGFADLALIDGRPAEAASILERAIAADATAHNTTGVATKYLMLAEARDGQGRRADAIAAIHHAVDTSDDVEVLLSAGRLFASMEQDEDARVLRQKLDAQGAPRTRVYAQVIDADMALARGQTGSAIQTLRASLSVMDLWIVRFVLGTAYLQAEQYDNALIELRVCEARSDEAVTLVAVDAPSLRFLALLTDLLARAQMGLAHGRSMSP